MPSIARSAGAFPDIPGWSQPLEAPTTYFRGRWHQKNWRNVPGPVYAADTDTCWASRMWAPHHITYENETFQEFLFRQPRSYSELMQVVCGAANDPLAGWAYDGDDHWTPALVREWWRDRRRLAEWMRRDLRTWMASDEPEQKDAAHGIAEYAAYLEDGLEDYLRNYVFWLSERRAPAANQRLPVL